MQADSAGNVYLTDWQYIYIYSADGSYLGSMDGSDRGADLYNYKDGSVGTLRYTGSGALSFCTIDPARLAFGDSYLLPADVRTILPGTGEYDLYYESDYSVYGWNAATGVSEKGSRLAGMRHRRRLHPEYRHPPRWPHLCHFL